MTTQSTTQTVSDNLAADAIAKANRTALAVKLADAGMADAKVLQGTLDEVSKTIATKAREIYVQRAKEFAGDESQIRDYLSGFRKGFEKSGDVRASEAGVIMRAWAKESARIEAHTGGMAGLIELARSIAGKQTGNKSRSGGTKAPTDKGMDSIVGRISAMKPAQAQAVVDKAMAQIVATHPDNFELAILRQIDNLTVQLAKSKQPIYQQLAKDIQDFCAEPLNREAIDAATNTAAHADAKQELPGFSHDAVIIPAPAQAAQEAKAA